MPNIKSSDRYASVIEVLKRFVHSNEDPLVLLVDLFNEVRPNKKLSKAEAAAKYVFIISTISSNETYRTAVREKTLDLFSRCHQVTFYSDAGILPNTGFYSELSRRITQRFLPDVPDASSLQDSIGAIFHGKRDDLFIESSERPAAFWRHIRIRDTQRKEILFKTLDQILQALQVLATRIAALGMEPELLRLMRELTVYESPFLSLSAEIQHFVDRYHQTLRVTDQKFADESQLVVIVNQCKSAVDWAEKKASTVGTSLRLTYILVRLKQSLRRLEILLYFLESRFQSGSDEKIHELWAEFFRNAVTGIVRRNSVQDHFSNLIRLLALRVTENASTTGEHYIASTKQQYWKMFRSAAGAGLLIGSMALLKILISKLSLPPLIQAAAYSLNYATCFIAVYMLHFTIATKQPAMTAATIAEAIGEKTPDQNRFEYLVDIIIDTIRTQIATIFGNVLVAFPTAIAVLLLWFYAAGSIPVTAEKAEHLLNDLLPIHGLALFHAAIAGVYLFLAGLISGYFDNRAAYSRVGERVANLKWLQQILGKKNAEKLANYIHDNLGGLTGNLFFGIMLGSTGMIGKIIGLPLDIRHVSFASANFGYALVALSFELPFQVLLWSFLGIFLIGLVNLFVSFGLALYTALRSRAIRHVPYMEILRLLWRRFFLNPFLFFQPPANTRKLELASDH
jgi:site-specific recombinase